MVPCVSNDIVNDLRGFDTLRRYFEREMLIGVVNGEEKNDLEVSGMRGSSQRRELHNFERI